VTRDGGARKVRAPRPPRIETLIVGAGQAGLALSHHLTAAGEEHVLLERGRVGQRWHERWDSLTLLSPNWMNRLPGDPVPADRDGFLPLAAFAAHLESYARSFAAPVVEGLEVERIERRGDCFRVGTTSGVWLTRSVVLATGDAADPHMPLAPPQEPLSLHSSEYRRPELVPDGPVLVVGAGTSGQQLALELRQAGRDVVLAAGRHSRAPRRYRGRDIFEWAHILGDFDRTIDELPDVEAAKRVPLFPLSGANGGEDLGLDRLAAAGVTVTGRLAGFDGTRAVFVDDLAANVAAADVRLRKLLQRIDAHPLAAGWEPEPLAAVILPPAPRTLDLRRVGAIVWATGFRRRYPWLHVPGVLDQRGEIVQHRGTTRVPGLRTLGLAYQYRRNSHFIGGVGRDAETTAHSIVERRAGRARARTSSVAA
jgi:putative flavoprotein involved in K+ transport